MQKKFTDVTTLRTLNMFL